MKVRLKTLMAGPEGVFHPGSVVHVTEDEAEAMVSAGYAERLDRPLETAGVEVAGVEPGSRATRPSARLRKTP